MKKYKIKRFKIKKTVDYNTLEIYSKGTFIMSKKLQNMILTPKL